MDILKFNDFIKLENKDLFETISSLFNNNILEQSIVFDHSLVKIFREIGNKNLIAEFLLGVFKGTGNKLDIDGEIKNVEEVFPHPSKADFLEIHFTKSNKTKVKSEMKVGKFINALVKEMNDRHLKPKPQEIEAFVKLFYAEVSGDVDSLYEFRVVDGDDILKYYDEKQSETLSGGLGGSCMRYSNRNKFMQFYSDIGHKKVEMLIRINPTTDKITGRALVWHLDSGKHYLDRIYVADNKDTKLLWDYAKKNLKCKFSYDFEGLDLEETVTIPKFKPVKMPYIDTFRHGFGFEDESMILTSRKEPIEGSLVKYDFDRVDGSFKFENVEDIGKFIIRGDIKTLKDGLTLEIIEEKFKWLGAIDINFENAVLGMNKVGLVWYNGTWKYGTWKDGTWKKGTWEAGVWENGIWKDGTWKNGIWKDGSWEKGTWIRGTWHWGTWYSGLWKNGIWQNGFWKDGTWEEGFRYSGRWVSGTWKNGKWKGGTWEDGIWENGTWEMGTWIKGTWKDGEGKPENA